MRDERSIGTASLPLVETLEGRTLLSAAVSAVAQPLMTDGPSTSHATVDLDQGSAKAAARAALTATRTALAASSQSVVLGQRLTLTAQVKSASSSARKPTGTVQFLDGKKVIGTAQVDGKGRATLAVSNLFTGSHTFTAAYGGSGSFKASRSAGVAVAIKRGTMTKLASGLEMATVQNGKGPGAVYGQSLRVHYTGYLTNGKKFDSSLNPGRSPFDFQLGGNVIQGWNQGLAGMKVGEQRVLIVPPALGYGSTPNGSIPANSTLIFIVKLLKFNTVPKLEITGRNNTPITNNQSPTSAAGTLFANTAVGQTSAAATFSLSNAGNAPLNFTSEPYLQISGANADDFVLTQPVISGSKATFTVKFTPKAAGDRTAKVVINTNDPRFPSFSFTIKGTGI